MNLKWNFTPLFFLLCWAIFGLPNAQAAEDWSVKLSSSPCADSTRALVSTATLLEFEGQTYALALSHEVLNGDQPDVCHRLLTAQGSALSATLVAWEWNGFALLKTTGRGLPLEILDKKITRDDSLAISGYARASSILKIVNGFRLIVTASDRGASESLAEIRGATSVDSGYAGAPVRNAAGAIIAFVASHYVDLDPGHPSAVSFWTPTSQAAHVFAHSASEAKLWMESVLHKTRKLNTFSRAWSDQLNGIKALAVGDYSLREDCPARHSTAEAARPYPIGGVDPVGIGGSSQGFGCRIWIERATSPLPAPAKSWYESLDSSARAGEKSEIVYVLRENPALDIIDRQLIGSLEELTHALEDQSANPLILTFARAPDSSHEAPGVDTRLAALRALGFTLQNRVKELFIRHQSTSSQKLQSLLRELYFLTVSVQSEQWKLSTPEMIDALLEPAQFADSWQILASPYLGGDKALREDFVQLSRELLKAQAL